MTLNDQVLPELLRVRGELAKLRACTIHVGIQGAGKDFEGSQITVENEILTIAHVHEYGATIHAKKAKNLCIPIHKESYDKSPRDFPDLHFIKSKRGYLLGVTEDETKRRKKSKSHDDYGVDDKQLKILFLLLPSVTIPERSFIRAGYDANRDNLEAEFQKAIGKIVHEGWTAQQAADYIGGAAVGFIRMYVNKSENFTPKGDIQKERAPSWADSPLTVTNRLLNSITWKVEGME